MVGRLSAVRSQLSTLLGNYLGRSLLPHQGHTTFPKDSSYPVIDQSRKERPGSLGLPGITKEPTQLQSLLWVREGLHWADTTVQLCLYPFPAPSTPPLPLTGVVAIVHWLSHVCLSYDPMDYSMPDLPILHHLRKLSQTYVH